MKLELPSTRSGLRFSLSLVMVFMVISSPILMLVNPTQVSAATTGNPNGIDTSSYHSNMPVSSNLTPIVNQDGDFTTQAALSLTRASQTNNFVASKAYYDISFRTATAGAIKTIEMEFPGGTYSGAATLVEATGIGPGVIAASSVDAITYTVTNAVNVPANTKIRIQISNINNPPTPSASLVVTITTRNAVSGIIDGPTATSAYNMVQVDNEQIAPGAVTTTKIASGAVTSGDIANGAITSEKPAESFMKKVEVVDDPGGHAVGWNPDGVTTQFTITDPAIGFPLQTFVSMHIADISFVAAYNCLVSDTSSGQFIIICETGPPDNTKLQYIVTNLPGNCVASMFPC